MTDNELLVEILLELQKLTEAETGVLDLITDCIHSVLGVGIALVVIYGINSWFPK